MVSIGALEGYSYFHCQLSKPVNFYIIGYSFNIQLYKQPESFFLFFFLLCSLQFAHNSLISDWTCLIM